MAEVLSIVAASLQLSEILLKLGTRGGKLIIRFKNAPNEVQRQAQTLKDFQKFCVSCQLLLSKHATVLDTVIEQDAITYIKALLKRSEATLDGLEQALANLEIQPADGRFATLRKGAPKLYNKRSISIRNSSHSMTSGNNSILTLYSIYGALWWTKGKWPCASKISSQ